MKGVTIQRRRPVFLALLGLALLLPAQAGGKDRRSRRQWQLRGKASWYDGKFRGRRTASGERFDKNKLTAVAPSCVDLRIRKGTDNTFEFILNDGDDEPVKMIDDDVVVFTVRDMLGGAAQFHKTNAGGTHLDGFNGKTEFTVDKNDIDAVSDIDTTFWVYDIRRIRVGGAENVYIAGQFIIEPTLKA
jgi:hypothetical protein